MSGAPLPFIPHLSGHLRPLRWAVRERALFLDAWTRGPWWVERKGEREAFITQSGWCITRVGCRITPAHPAASLKRPAPERANRNCGWHTARQHLCAVLTDLHLHPWSSLYILCGPQLNAFCWLACSHNGSGSLRSNLPQFFIRALDWITSSLFSTPDLYGVAGCPRSL